MVGYIYGLFDTSGELRYIGQTTQSLHKRFNAHIKDANRVRNVPQKSSHRTNWINSLLKHNQLPSIKAIQTLYSEQDLNDAEIYWISYFRNAGCKLVNQTDGGYGLRGFKETAEQRVKRTIKLRGRKLSPEHVQKIKEANVGQISHFKGKKRTEENCRKISQSKLGKKHSEYSKLKMSLAHRGQEAYWKGKKLPDEVKAKISKSVSDYLKDHPPRAIAIIDQHGNIYKSYKAAAIAINGNRNMIAKVVSGEISEYKGYIFKIYKENLNEL